MQGQIVETTGAATKRLSSGRSAATPIEQLRFDLLRSALYHDMRETFLMRAHRLSLFAIVLLGSGAIAGFGAQYPLAGQVAGLLVAVISGAQLVWDFAGAAKDHDVLRRRFYELLADAGAKDADVSALTSLMTRIFADEPPVRHRTNRRAHNRAGKNMYGNDFNHA